MTYRFIRGCVTRCYSSDKSKKHPSFKFCDLIVNKVDPKCLKKKPADKDLVFGKFFTDHMLQIQSDYETGWCKPVIGPFEDLKIHPAAKVLHYAITLFEGLKAYYCKDKKIRLFRPEENMARMNKAAERYGFLQFDGEELIKCICELIKIDREWAPKIKFGSLYVRPTLIGNEPCLGLKMSRTGLLFVVLSPVGAYSGAVADPITILADPTHVRAWYGGVGYIKVGSNYAPTIQLQMRAMEQGHEQALWLFGDEQQVTEAGTLNLFIVIKNDDGEKEMITPCLNGLILPGVTRKSVLEMVRQWNEFKVTERVILMCEVLKLLEEGRILEIFGTGTAVVISPMKGIFYKDKMIKVPTMEQKEPVYKKVLNQLTDIQFGVTEHCWSRVVE